VYISSVVIYITVKSVKTWWCWT